MMIRLADDVEADPGQHRDARSARWVWTPWYVRVDRRRRQPCRHRSLSPLEQPSNPPRSRLQPSPRSGVSGGNPRRRRSVGGNPRSSTFEPLPRMPQPSHRTCAVRDT